MRSYIAVREKLDRRRLYDIVDSPVGPRVL
jgi:hypothetical protein